MKKILLFIIIISVSFSLFAQTNPFLKSSSNKQITQINKPYKQSAFINYISVLQKKLNRIISSYMKEIKEDKSYYKLFFIFSLSFLYGLLHALGPGHRKTVIVSYFLSNKGTVKNAVSSGFSLAGLHAGSAIIIISMLYFILKKSLMNSFNDFNFQLERISYLMIAVTGIVLLTLKIFEIIKKNNKKNISSKRLLAIIISSGLVPCPGAALILIFSISQHIFFTGIFTVIFMSLGMGLVISFFAVLTVISKDRLLESGFLENRHRMTGNILEICGSLFIFLFGLIMFLPYI